MYQLSLDQIQKILDLQNNLNKLEIRGIQNITIMYSSMAILQQLLDDLQKQAQGITIDNTKEK